MKILFWGILLVVAAFLIHLLAWKIRLPRRQTKVLLQIFFGTLVAGLVFLWFNPSFQLFKIPAPTLWVEFLHISFMFTAFTLAYMITYSGLEADSPSLVMVLHIAKEGDKGLAKDTFYREMNDDVLVRPRVQDLLLDHMAYLEGDRYRLTAKGKLMARLFVNYRKLMNAGKGG